MEKRIVEWPQSGSGKYFLCEYREGKGYFPLETCERPSGQPLWDSSIPFWKV